MINLNGLLDERAFGHDVDSLQAANEYLERLLFATARKHNQVWEELESMKESSGIYDKSLPFLSFPREVRDQIYKYALQATREAFVGVRHIRMLSCDTFPDSTHYPFKPPTPGLLLVNKQIYEEASSMFFTEATIVICCNDLFFLSNKAFRMGTIFGENPWRYNPLTAVAKKLPGGTIQYDQEDLGGWLEPHMFAKFQKVVLDCALEVEHTENVQLFFDVETGKFDSEDETRFRNYIRNLTFVKDFVKILSKSSVVNQLTINVLVEVTAETRLDAESIDTEDEEEMEEMDEKQDMADLEANIAATEIFMDCGLFKTLRHLKNVRKLEFRTGFADFEPPVDYKPKEKHQIMAQKLKSLVERNFKAPEESTRGGLRSQGSITQHGAL